MASGKITNKNTISGSISSGNNLKNASITSGSGTTDHSRLINRAKEDQHPIEAITGLREELDSKLDSTTALPLINEAIQGKAKGLYFDTLKELARKSYWYLTAEVDPKTGLGTKDSIISGPYDLGMGGGSGGGGGGVTTVSIKQINWPATTVVGNPLSLSVEWSSTIGEEKEPTGNGTLYLIINGKQTSVKSNQTQGVVTFENVVLPIGENTIEIKIMDAYGTTKPTVGSITAVELLITDDSVFNDGTAWQETVVYKYKAFGNFSKKVYFIVDGNQYTTETVTSSGDLKELTITGLSHGAHALEVYFTAELNGETVPSNRLYHELIVYEKDNSIPIIASSFPKESIQEQYASFNIPYYVYSDTLTRPRVYYYVEYQGIRTELETFAGGIQVDRTLQKLPYRFDTYYEDESLNNYSLIIKCGTTEKKFNITVAKSSINITPVMTALALHLDAQGRSNTEANRASWIDKASKISCELTGFNWASNGWMTDLNTNESFLRLNAGAKVTVPYKVLSGTPQLGGKTIELDFAARDIRDYETPILTCRNAAVRKFYDVSTTFVDADIRAKNFTVTLNQDLFTAVYPNAGTYIFEYVEGDSWQLISGESADLAACGITLTEHLENEEGEHPDKWKLVGDLIVISVVEDAIGFYVTPQKAAIRSLQSKLSVQFKEEEHVRISMVIEDASTTSPTHILWIYVNGIASCAIQYPLQGENFAHENFMYLGADDGVATLDIYNIRVYNQALTSKQIVENWIADTQDPVLRASRYAKNNIYDAWSGKITPESIEALGDLPYIIWDIDTLPQFKGDKRLGNVVYKDPLGKDRSFKSGDATYNVQGTSSAGYPVKNIRIKYKQAKAEDFPNCDFWWENGYENEDGETIKKFPITIGGIGDNYFTYKVDYASSEGANNVELTKLYNDLSKELAILTPPQRQDSRVRIGIDGFPIVAFHENAEGIRSFCTKANFNNDKDNEDVYGFADGDESWEITNNSFRTTKFKAGVNITDKSSSDYYSKAFEARFPEDNENLSRLKAMTDWVASTDPEQATGKSLSEVLGKPSVTFDYKDKELGEDNSYKDVEKSETFNIDSREYRITKFKAELKDWFDIDSTLLYYLFTELFLMIDSRAKNAFPTYFKSRQEGDGGDRWFWIPYDMDTALGINNMGELVFDYSLEDHGEFGKYAGGKVYNGQESVMWNNIREGFYGQLSAMYARMRSSLINFAEIDGRFEEHQSKWPEAIFNEDAIIKYVNPLRSKAEGGLGENYLSMLQGSKAQQRKWWLYNRLRYIDSKYNAADAKSDYIQFRAYAGGAGSVKPSISVIPYTDIYAAVSYSNGELKTVRAPRNIVTTVPTSFTTEDDSNEQETYIYSASQLKDIGDLAPFYAKTVKVAAATKLQKLKVGDDGQKYPGYKNENLRQLELGENTLLKVLDVRNCVNLGKNDEQNATPTVDIRNCINIEDIYFTGTQITGIQLPDGGTIKNLYLPGTMQSLIIRNQPMIQNLQIDTVQDNSIEYLALENLWLENVPFDKISAKRMLELMLNKPTSLIGSAYSEEFGKYQRGVCLRGINEHLEAANELLELTNLLDNFFGLKIINELIVADTESKAIVSGTVTLSGPINYSTLVELGDWDEAEQAWRLKAYKDLLIKAPNTICKVVFNLENGGEPIVRNIRQGAILDTKLENITGPKKPSEIDKVFEFSHWVELSGKTFEDGFAVTVDKDLTFTAIYTAKVREYTVRFNSNSNIISVLPTEVQVAYGNTVPVPTITGIPEKVELVGWLDPSGHLWDFTNSRVESDLVLTAQWEDLEKPSINLTVLNANTIKYTAKDNVGISAWGVTINSSTQPDDWKQLESPVNILSDEFIVTEGGLHTFWIKDIAGYTASAEIQVYSVEAEMKSDGIKSYIFYFDDLDGVRHELSGAAIENTKIRLAVAVDDHYTDLLVSLNNKFIAINKEITVNQDLLIELSCSPKTYTVNFDLGGKGKEISPQEIIYQHLINEPASQYWAPTNEVITGWYLDSQYSQRWDFEIDRVEDNVSTGFILDDDGFTLYAKWTIVEMPTTLTINIPEDAASYTVRVNYSNSITAADYEWVRVNFGDGDSTFYVSDDGELTHTYTTPGTKIIEIYGNNKGYSLGKDADKPLLAPSNYLTSVELAWDLSTISMYAFKGAVNLTQLPDMDYISIIGEGAFENCTGITVDNLDLPKNLISLGASAFAGCTGLTGTLKLSENLQSIGTNAFRGCKGLKKVVFDCPQLTVLPAQVFVDCSNLEYINIPITVTELGTSCFAACTNLTKVILNNPELQVGQYCFNDCKLLYTAGPLNSKDSSGDEVNIEYAWTTKIPAYAFCYGSGQSWLEEVLFPGNLKEIGIQAFMNTKLTTLTLLDGCTTIGEEAFAWTKLKKIQIPPSITNIGARAFGYCINLTEAYFYPTGVDTMIEEVTKNNAWFNGSKSLAKIWVNPAVFNDSVNPKDKFGAYWDYLGVDFSTNDEMFIKEVLAADI